MEVCHSAEWGLVCASSNSWQTTAAHVACNEFGVPSLSKLLYAQRCLLSDFTTLDYYTDPRALIDYATLYDATIVLNDVVCSGDESSIIECSGTGYGSNINCAAIAVAQCEGQ